MHLPSVLAALSLGLPVAAMARWARQRGADGIETAAAGFAGLGLAVPPVWAAAMLLGFRASALLVGTTVAAAIVVGVTGRDHGSPAPGADGGRDTRRLALIGLVLVVATLVPFLTYGLETSRGVHVMSMADWGKHLAFVTELSAGDDFPIANPYLRSSGASPYYAGFHLLAGALARAAGGPGAAFPALLLLTAVVGFAIPVAIYLVARKLTGCRRKSVIAAGAGTLLGGWDIVPLTLSTLRDTIDAWPLPGGLAGLRAVIPSINPDFWIHHNERQFYPPYRATMWAPHHMFAAVLALLAIYWLWFAPRTRRGDGILCGLLLAGSLAASAYVAVAAAAWLAAAFLADCWQSRRRPWNSPLWPAWLVAGITAVVTALPILEVLRSAGNGALTLHISSAGTWANGALVTTLLGDGQLQRLLDTPAVLLFDFGLVGVLATLALARRSGEAGRSPTGLIAGLLAVVALCVLFRPPVGGPNNLYGRGLLLVWFIAAPMAVEGWCRLRSTRALRVGALVAALYLPYGMVGATLEGALFRAAPADDYAAAHWLAQESPVTAVVAFAEPAPRYLDYWLRRRIAYDDPRLARLFGATEEQMRNAEGRLADAFGASTPGIAARELAALGADWAVYAADAIGFDDASAPACWRVRHQVGRWRIAESVLSEC